MTQAFSNAGYGQGEVGWGTRPAVIAVDFQMAFCDPKYALGRSQHAQRAISNAARLFRQPAPLEFQSSTPRLPGHMTLSLPDGKFRLFAIFNLAHTKQKFTQIFGMTMTFTF